MLQNSALFSTKLKLRSDHHFDFLDDIRLFANRLPNAGVHHVQLFGQHRNVKLLFALKELVESADGESRGAGDLRH